jgi:valyl-tRNA synthetase
MSNSSQVNLSSNYNPKESEERIKLVWKESQFSKPEYWENLAEENKTYTIIVPPPNLTGDLHSGHAFEHFFMDTISRLARQRKYQTLYYPGVDHAGIQLEGVIDKFINSGEFDEIFSSNYPAIFDHAKSDRANYLKKHNLDLYLDLAWKKVNTYRNNQIALAHEIGDSPDFDRLLFTLDAQSRNMVFEAFNRFYQDGIIYKDSYLINWSVALQTALSDVPEDISRKEITDPFITYRYDIENIIFHNLDLSTEDLKKSIFDALISLQVGTVRIETVIASKQLMAHPETIARLLVNKTNLDETVILDIINKLKNREIIIFYQIPPLNLYNVELYLEETLDPDFGTGVMKFTPAHDPTDYSLAQKHKIYNFPTVINKQGKLTDVNGEFSGLDVYNARLRIIYILIIKGYVDKIADLEINFEGFDPAFLFSCEYSTGVNYLKKYFSNYNIDWEYKHNVIICERSKTIVEPLISEEWFVDYKKEFNYKPNQQWKFDQIDLAKVNINYKQINLEDLKPNFSEFINEMITNEDCDLLLCEEIPDYESAKIWVDEQIKHNKTKSRITFAITNHQKNYVGYCCVRKENDEYKLTIWIAEPFRKQGFATTALEALIDWSFQNLTADYLIWEVKSYNYKSIKLAEKLNFKLIGSPTYDQVNKETGKVTQAFFHVLKRNREKETLQQLALDGINQTTFLPSEYKTRGIDYFQNIKDWCISRSLVWGIKMPIWYNIELNPDKIFYNYSEYSNQIQLNGKVYQIKDLMRVSLNKPTDYGNWVQEEKILDTWFSSTLWPLSTLNFLDYHENNVIGSKDFAKFYPTQLMTSAWEIFYAWIVRMIMNGMYFTGSTPFENYFCHAWILDEKGRKMSKSLGNVFDPREQIEKYSIDAVRLGMLSGSSAGKNLRFQGKIADDLCEKYKNFANKIHNTGRFFEFQFTQTDEITKQYCYSLLQNQNKIYNLEISPASIWILNKFIQLKNSIDNNLKDFDVSQSIENLYKFLWEDFSNWYLEYLKTDSTQLAFGFLVFYGYIQLLHPFSPYQTEFLNQNLFKQNQLLSESLISLDYLRNIDDLPQKSIQEFNVVIEIITNLRSSKALFGLDPVLNLNFYSSDEELIKYKQYFYLTTKCHLIIKEPNNNEYIVNGTNWKIGLNLINQIKDVSLDIKKTNLKLLDINKQIDALESILNNENFVQNADPEIISKKQQDLQLRNIDKMNLLNKLEYLKTR